MTVFETPNATRALRKAAFRALARFGVNQNNQLLMSRALHASNSDITFDKGYRFSLNLIIHPIVDVYMNSRVSSTSDTVRDTTRFDTTDTPLAFVGVG
ncbi:hypothetical protein E4U17_006020 [Claviceps sp. LM77 group G4]|nr:hypothetical protein E4U17_006020 [Claviceps sp. LM77 group G4]KAG6067904.1 hypothetical protein E4U33_005172 [Claviceps sp. LM78 group G4]